MKKIIALMLCAVALFLAACSAKDESSTGSSSDNSQTASIDFDSLEVVNWESDHIMCNSVAELDNYSDIAVIDTITDDIESVSEYDDVNGFDQKVLVNIYSYTTVKVDKVLKGDVNVGDEITVFQNCGVDNNKLVTFSEMKPMEKGDQWIFFLSYDSERQGYWCVGDYTSRFPVPQSQIATLSLSNNADSDAELENDVNKMTNDDFGVYGNVDPAKELYCDLITHYDCTLQ